MKLLQKETEIGEKLRFITVIERDEKRGEIMSL